MKLYAYSIMAMRVGYTGTEIKTSSGACVAQNDHEARGIALEQCYKTYSTQDGYANQTAVICLVPDTLLEMVES